YQVLQVAPSVAWRVTERVSVAAGPTLDLAILKADPFLGAAPDDANGDGFFTFPQGTHTHDTWGGGFVVGAFYQGAAWALGASVRSPQWFNTFRYNSSDELGRRRSFGFDVDLPLTVSLGASYTGLASLVLAADVRYLDYSDTKGFGDTGFTPGGAIRGVS